MQVGDIEPFGGAEPAGWIDEIMQWSRAYQEAAGEPLAFFDVDIIWGGPWQRQLELFVPRLSAGGLKFGIIYNGDPSDQTGTAWTRRAEHRFAAIEANPALTPDQAILQSWMPHPAHMLPETEAGTMTWLVNRYLAAEARWVLHRAGDQLEGRLTDVTGKPLAGAKVDIAAEQTGKLSLHLFIADPAKCQRTPSRRSLACALMPNAVAPVRPIFQSVRCDTTTIPPARLCSGRSTRLLHPAKPH